MKKNNEIQNLIKLHTHTYDALAKDYEKRAKDLIVVTKKNTDWMSKYVSKNGKILDLGCGVGLATSFFIKKGFKLTCIDISSKMISYAKKRNKNANFVKGDFLTTNFNSQFDGIFAFSFIHLFPKIIVNQILKKIYNILNPGGIAFIESTKSKKGSEGWEIKKDYFGKHKRFRKHWTKKELQETLIQANFRILDSRECLDPFGKTWISFIVQKPF